MARRRYSGWAGRTRYWSTSMMSSGRTIYARLESSVARAGRRRFSHSCFVQRIPANAFVGAISAEVLVVKFSTPLSLHLGHETRSSLPVSEALASSANVSMTRLTPARQGAGLKPCVGSASALYFIQAASVGVA